MYKKNIQEQRRINRGLALGFELIDKFLQNGGILSKYITRYTDVVFRTDNIIVENCFYVFFTMCLDDPVLVKGIVNLINRYKDYLERVDTVYAQHLLRYGKSEAIEAFAPYLLQNRDDGVIDLYMEYAVKHRQKQLGNNTIKIIENILYKDNVFVMVKGVTNNGKKR